VSLRWSLASQQIMGSGYIHCAFTGCLGRSSPFGAASMADALAERLLFCGLAGFLQQPVHHWHLLSSNQWAVLTNIYFQQLTNVTFASLSAFS
jgi:hypothetical protein